MAPNHPKKDHKTRQKEYRERNKERLQNEDRVRKQQQRQKLKSSNPELYKEKKEKDAERKRKARAEALRKKKKNMRDATAQTGDQQNTSSNAFKHWSSLRRSVKRARAALPKSPSKKVQVVNELLDDIHASSLQEKRMRRNSPTSERARKMTEEAKVLAKMFLERNDVSYTCPGRRDTVYCGKDEKGEKVYREKHYLLWTYRELLPMLNEELGKTLGEEKKIGYGTFQSFMTTQHHIKQVGQTPHFTCLCPKCENMDLLIQSINAKDFCLPTSSKSLLMSLIQCNPENTDCVDGTCDACPGLQALSSCFDSLKKVDHLTYYQWKKQEGKHYPEKVQVESTGKEACRELTNQLLDFKRHHYNRLRQHAEMSYKRQHLEADEVLIQVDYSENYENRQQHEIQSAYFGHDAFSIYTACIWYRVQEQTYAETYAMVSGNTKHDKFGAFQCNQKLIELAKQLVPDLKHVHFWSDGCAAQFKSRFCFSLLTRYAESLEVTWSFFESHHGKGVVDAVGGTVKAAVYRDVCARKVIIQTAEQFATYANRILKVNVLFMKSVEEFDISCAVAIPRTQAVHFVKRRKSQEGQTLEFYLNSQFQACDPCLGTAIYENGSASYHAAS